MITLENQQVTASWFVGILEGEGHFEKRQDGSARITITNTDLDIIRNCELFLKINNILFSTYSAKKINGRKQVHRVVITKSRNFILNYAQELYNLIESKLECRKHQFQEILAGTSEITCDPCIDFDWLIGIWEAEGSFSLILNQNVARLGINIANTNFSIIEKVAKTLKSLNCPFYVFDLNQTTKNKPKKVLTITGIMRCTKFLKATEGKWIATRNKKRTSLMLEFVKSRLSRIDKEPYSTRELSIIQAMKDLNMKG